MHGRRRRRRESEGVQQIKGQIWKKSQSVKKKKKPDNSWTGLDFGPVYRFMDGLYLILVGNERTEAPHQGCPIVLLLLLFGLTRSQGVVGSLGRPVKKQNIGKRGGGRGWQGVWQVVTCRLTCLEDEAAVITTYIRARNQEVMKAWNQEVMNILIIDYCAWCV